MRRSVLVFVAALLIWPVTGCVMAVRHLAKEANRSSVQSKARQRFPAGTTMETARTAMIAEGYWCLDMAADRKVKAHLSCWPGKRSDKVETFLIGGNWRWDLFETGGQLTEVHISSARHGLRRRQEPEGSAPSSPPQSPPAAKPGSAS